MVIVFHWNESDGEIGIRFQKGVPNVGSTVIFRSAEDADVMKRISMFTTSICAAVRSRIGVAQPISAMLLICSIRLLKKIRSSHLHLPVLPMHTADYL